MRANSGLILLQTLIFISLLALISFFALENIHIELNTVRLHREQINTFNQAQQTLETAEVWLINLAQKPLIQTHCKTQPCIEDFSNTRDWHNLEYWKKHSINLGSFKEPRFYIIELLATQTSTNITEYYQITALSRSTEQHSERIIQAVLSKNFNAEGISLSSKLESWRLLR